MSSLNSFSACALLFLVLSSCSKPSPEVKTENPLFAKFETVSLKPVSRSFETAGETKAQEEILVSAERAGQVEKIHVREGNFVTAGTLLVSIKGDDVQADLKKAEADYVSYKKLYEEGAASQIEFRQYEANLSRVKSQLSNLNITAITDGVIGQIYINLGDYVTNGNKILDLVKLYPLRISYSVPERLIPKIKLGQNLNFTVESHPNETFTASVDFISPRIDPNSRTVLVRALVNDPNKQLRANQFVKVKQVIDQISDALMVREEAVYLDQGQEYLFVADPIESEEESSNGETLDQKTSAPAPTHIARKIPIKTGIREPGWVEILDGLQEGEEVIYAGLTSMYPGAKLIKVPNEKE
jgi:RND family efflux transporter MFP subunit